MGSKHKCIVQGNTSEELLCLHTAHVSFDFQGEMLQLCPCGQWTQLNYWDRRSNIISN